MLLVFFFLILYIRAFDSCDLAISPVQISKLRPDPMVIYRGRSVTFDVEGTNMGDPISDGYIKLTISAGFISETHVIKLKEAGVVMGKNWHMVYTRNIPDNVPTGWYKMTIELFTEDDVRMKCVTTPMIVKKPKAGAAMTEHSSSIMEFLDYLYCAVKSKPCS